MRRILCCGILAYAAVASGSEGAEELECGGAARMAAQMAMFDPQTGARTEQFPPDRPVDIEHVTLRLNFPDLLEKRMEGWAALTFTARQDGVRVLDLNAEGLRIRSVTSDRMDSHPAAVEKYRYFHDGKILSVEMPAELGVGERAGLVITYEMIDPTGGIEWYIPPDGDVDPRPEVWTQGQTSGNRNWFPLPDYPNDFFTTESYITAPSPNTVIANGRIVNRTENGDGTVTYHHRMNVPHAGYLTSFIVGQFARGAEMLGDVSVEYYVPPNREADIERSFRETPNMIAHFGDLFGVAYPYEKYAQTVVRNFWHGGMENITASTLHAHVLFDEENERHGRGCDDGAISLVAHELGHQWFGDLVTCRNWVHVWLNEGWATYCETLWFEHECGREEYEYDIWKNHRNVIRSDSVDDPRSLVWPTAQGGGAIGFKGSLVYNKGSVVLHMLREEIGSEAFFAGTGSYLRENANQPVITDHFRQAMERASGRDLEQWFHQWVHTPGVPLFHVELSHDFEQGEAVVAIEQMQTINETTHAFWGDLELLFVDADGVETRTTHRITNRKEVLRVAMNAPPVLLVPDPRLRILGTKLQKIPAEMLVRAANDAPTTHARLEAVWNLGQRKDREGVAALAAIAASEADFYGVREQALLALGGIQTKESEAALLSLGGTEIADHRVRRAYVEALGKQPPQKTFGLLRSYCEDPADVVAREALEAIGRCDHEDTWSVLLAGYERRGNHDRVRASALAGMERQGDPRGIALALDAAAPGISHRVRRSAMGVARDLATGAEVDDDTFHTLAEFVHDDDARVRDAAVAALGNLGDARARRILEGLTSNTTDEGLANAARQALDRISAGKSSANPRPETQRITALEEELRKLKKDLEEKENRAREDFRNGTGTKPEKKRRRRFLGIF